MKALGVAGYALVSVVAIMTTILGIVLIANMYLGGVVVREYNMVLLINTATGEVLPWVDYEPGWTAGMILSNYIKRSGARLFGGGIPDIKDKVLHELAEVMIVDWFVKTQTTHMTSDGRIIRIAVRFPALGKRLNAYTPSDLVKMFGENSLSDIALASRGPIPNMTLHIPRCFRVYAHRHAWRELAISASIGETELYRKLIGGLPRN